MSSVVVERAPSLFDVLVERDLERSDEAAPRAVSPFDAVGDEPTLDEVLSGVWEGLIAHRVEECPVCSGEIVPNYAQHSLPIGGHCVDCGSVLS